MIQSDIIHLRSEQLEITLLAQGAAVVGVRFVGSPQNMVLGFADPADHLRIPVFAGPLVGPVANRIAQGQLSIAGTRYQMPRNENGRTTLHSGGDGLHSHKWSIKAQNTNAVTFTTHLSDGQNALPGNRTITAHYSLQGAALTLDISATSSAETLMNIAPHIYWNLDGAPDVSGHLLQVDAQHYLPVDRDMLPTGEVRPVQDTQFDYRRPQSVPLDPDLDVNFCLHTTPQRTLSHAVTLTGSNGTRLDITTTKPGLQVYNGAFLPSDPLIMADCPPFAPYSAIALEPQGWPDAPNQSSFPSIALSPQTPYAQTSIFTLSQPQ